MIIKPDDQTITSLLSNTHERFVIPSYQRRYAWEEAQQKAFFKDLDMLLPDEGHLFGMLILHTTPHHGGINDVYLVDGQQRFTTLSILLLVLLERFEERGEKYLVQQIQQKLYCLDPKDKDPKLVLGELDNSDYLKLLKKNLEEIENPNILDCYNNFKKWVQEKIDEEGKDWLNNYYNVLTQQAMIIRLDVQQAKDAYKLFETINNRGLGLSATDILKNFILGHAAKLSDEKLEVVKDLWTKLIVTLDGNNTDDFFRQFMSSLLTQRVTKSKLIEEFKNHYFDHVKEVDKLGEFLYANGPLEDDEEDFDEEDTEEINYEDIGDEIESPERISIDEYLQKIVSAAVTYKKITHLNFEDSKINQKIKDLQDIKSFTSNIFLMHYLGEGHPRDQVLKVLDLIGTLMLRRHITGKRTADNDDIFANLLRYDIDERTPEKINQYFLDSYPTDEDFENNFPVHDFRRVKGRARYILTQIEYYMTGNTGELSVNSPKEVHLEHIIPEKIHTKKSKDKFGDWKSYLGENAELTHKKKKDRIGNLTLLAGDLNISASNNPYMKKIDCYKKSNIELTKQLADKKDFKFDDLDKRGKELANLALKIWSF